MNIVADTCFWISLCDSTQANHSEVVSMMEKIIKDNCHRILVPHPVLYETLCSEMVKKPEQVILLTKYFENVVKVSDYSYIETAYRLVEQQANLHNGTASMVDFSIMLIAADPKNDVRGILTQNGRDFSAFCHKHRMPMIDRMEILMAI